MKTSLRILFFAFVIQGLAVNFSFAQLNGSCAAIIYGQNKVCPSGCTTLNAQFGSSALCTNVTYQWAPGGQTTSSIVVCPKATTTYTVNACCTSPNPCCDTAVFTVMVAPTMTVAITGPNTVCAGQGSSLCAGSGLTGVTYLWVPGAQTTNCIYASPSVTTTYTVTLTNQLGCTAIDSFKLNVINCNVSPCTASITGKTQVCSGGCTTLNAGFSTSLNYSSLTYQWMPGGQTTSSIVVCPTAATSYSVVVCCISIPNNCCDTASISVSISLPPVVKISGPDTICSGQGTNLCANTGVSYLWMPGNLTTSCINASPSATTTYTVIITDANGCSGMDTFRLNVKTCTSTGCVASIYGQNKICAGSCTTLNAWLSSNINCTSTTYIWSAGGQTTSSIVVCPTSTTTYMAMICCNGSSSSCCDSASFTVIVMPSPTVTVLGPTSICAGQTATLCDGSGNLGFTYSWMPGGQTTNCITDAPSSTTTYTLTLTGPNGCVSSTTHMLTVINCTTDMMENVLSNQINIFPNPFSDQTTIHIFNAQVIPSELCIYNLLGVEVKRIHLENVETTISRENLSSGIYYYRLSQQGRSMGNGKLVIE